MRVAADATPLPAALTEGLTVARERLRKALADEPRGGLLLQHFSEALIEGVTAAAAQAIGRAERRFGRLAVVVVGGLARGEHCPHSDVDLIVLGDGPGGPTGEPFAAWLREFCHPLWDAGLRLRTTVHGAPSWLDAAAAELSLCTALLDMRLLAGDRELVDELAAEAHRRFFGEQRASFLHRLNDDAAQRRARYGSTVYQVEPDLKFGPGGTRDIAMFEWAVLARRRRPEPWDPAKFESAVKATGVPPRAAHLLAEARDTILRLRAALHLVAGRTQDRLVFQYQEGMPELLGVELARGPGGRVDDGELVAAIEACMQEYYRSAREVLRYGGRVFARCQPPRLRAELEQRVDERFSIVDGGLRHTGKDPFADTPVLGLEAIAIARDRHIGLSGPTHDAIVEATVAIPEGDPRLAEDSVAQQRFMELLVDPTDVGSPTTLELCAEVGLLERLVPEFAASRGRMQHEGFHVYTVDQHSIYAVEFLKAIARGDHLKDYSMATALHLGIDDPRPLYLATLLHDAGKPFGDQSAVGARIAELAADRAGFDASDVARCRFLVAEHLTMPLLSQKRDLTDELLIREFAETVGSRRTLDELYLVSLADMANVAPEFLTTWKLTLLDELYLRTAAEFASRGWRAAVARRPREDEPEGLPPRYYSLFDPELRRAHRGMLDALQASGKPLVVDLGEGSGAMRLTLVTHDRLGLLATLTGALAELGLEVVAADVFSVPLSPRVALDVFRVVPRDPAGRLGGPAGTHEVDWAVHIEARLSSALATPVAASELAEPLPPMPGPRRGRRRGAATKVRFSEDPAGSRTIVDVETVEYPGVAARISRAFSAPGLGIELARINAEAGRVDAVFYVSKLEPGRREALAEAIHANLRTRSVPY